ncbi:MAG: response regulator [Verrucomicrobiota bacterium]
MKDSPCILFVDDDKDSLYALQRELRPLEDKWEILYISRPSEAISTLESRKIDIIISDMRMPFMNGSELLNYVMFRFPETIRFILSSFADQDLVIKCIGSTHQYLAKPCKLEVIENTITQAIKTRQSMKREALSRFVAKIGHFPRIPPMYVKMIEKVQDPNVKTVDFIKIIELDPIVSAKIICTANSSYFKLPDNIATLEAAIQHLGIDMIKHLVLALKAFDALKVPDFYSFKDDKLWNHSLEVANISQKLFQLEGFSAVEQQTAFISGLLHDIGKQVLASNFPDEYGEAVELSLDTELDSLIAEQGCFEVNHADVGGYLLALWGLPDPIVEAIFLHHSPRSSSNQNFSPLYAVHVANYLAHRRNRSAHIENFILDVDLLNNIGVGNRIEKWATELDICESVALS